MSKLLKVIVNTLLLLAILSAGALVIPPFAGITTLVSDGMGNTNISRGAVTYAKKTDTSSVATGDKILVDDNSGKYIYTIQSLDTAAGTASVKNVISGDRESNREQSDRHDSGDRLSVDGGAEQRGNHDHRTCHSVSGHFVHPFRGVET